MRGPISPNSTKSENNSCSCNRMWARNRNESSEFLYHRSSAIPNIEVRLIFPFSKTGQGSSLFALLIFGNDLTELAHHIERQRIVDIIHLAKFTWMFCFYVSTEYCNINPYLWWRRNILCRRFERTLDTHFVSVEVEIAPKPIADIAVTKQSRLVEII